MSELTYEDFKRRLNIQDLLIDAGYHLNRRDGLRYPSYVRLDSDGRRIRGDKFIVTGNGTCCFQPPVYKNYNVISFIKEHPDFFPDYKPGMSPDRLVNLVCNRLLNHPIDERDVRILAPQKLQRPFLVEQYALHHFTAGDFESQKKFYPFFKHRGLDLRTQHDFKEHFLLATKTASNGRSYTNLAFPLHVPGKDMMVGFEERGIPNKEGVAYKGMAEGSNASNGLWIANLTGKSLSQAEDVYWFESAYDAMAYRQLHRDKGIEINAVFVSTGGNPSESQFKGVLNHIRSATHHLCFDHDKAGMTFAANFALVANGQRPVAHEFISDAEENDTKSVLDIVKNHLGSNASAPILSMDLKAYIQSLRDRTDMMSGDVMLLPAPLRSLYGQYESIADELYQVTHPRQLCDDDIADMKAQLNEYKNAYIMAMKECLPDLKGAQIIRELPQEPYKDWNDQLLGEFQHHERVETDVGRSVFHR